VPRRAIGPSRRASPASPLSGGHLGRTRLRVSALTTSHPICSSPLLPPYRRPTVQISRVPHGRLSENCSARTERRKGPACRRWLSPKSRLPGWLRLHPPFKAFRRGRRRRARLIAALLQARYVTIPRRCAPGAHGAHAVGPGNLALRYAGDRQLACGYTGVRARPYPVRASCARTRAAATCASPGPRPRSGGIATKRGFYHFVEVAAGRRRVGEPPAQMLPPTRSAETVG
jgi:hypothetical protein